MIVSERIFASVGRVGTYELLAAAARAFERACVTHGREVRSATLVVPSVVEKYSGVTQGGRAHRRRESSTAASSRRSPTHTAAIAVQGRIHKTRIELE